MNPGVAKRLANECHHHRRVSITTEQQAALSIQTFCSSKEDTGQRVGAVVAGTLELRSGCLLQCRISQFMKKLTLSPAEFLRHPVEHSR